MSDTQTEFERLCQACEVEPVWRAGILQTLRDMNDNMEKLLKLFDDKASFANRELSTIDCRLQTIENNIVPLTKLVDSCDSRLQAIDSNTDR